MSGVHYCFFFLVPGLFWVIILLTVISLIVFCFLSSFGWVVLVFCVNFLFVCSNDLLVGHCLALKYLRGRSVVACMECRAVYHSSMLVCLHTNIDSRALIDSASDRMDMSRLPSDGELLLSILGSKT